MKKLIVVLICIMSLLVISAGAIVGVYLYKYSQINYTVNDTLPDGEGKKVKVILLAGQSNASGCSVDEYLKKNVTEEK